jgi:type II secretory pathway pseudopilin PulG
MKMKNVLTRRNLILLIVIIIVGIVGGALFTANSDSGSAKETQASKEVANQYLTYVRACNLEGAKQLRKYGISDKDEVSLLCNKGCKPFSFDYVKIYEPLKTEVVPGDPEQEPIKSITFQYQMTCGSEKKPYMMGMEYSSEEQKWQVFLDTSIGDPSAL